jgi:hypothetical protein
MKNEETQNEIIINSDTGEIVPVSKDEKVIIETKEKIFTLKDEISKLRDIIKDSSVNAVKKAWEIGKILTDAKKNISHGNYNIFIKNSGLGVVTAHRYKSIYKNFNKDQLNDFDSMNSALKKLSLTPARQLKDKQKLQKLDFEKTSNVSIKLSKLINELTEIIQDGTNKDKIDKIELKQLNSILSNFIKQ